MITTIAFRPASASCSTVTTPTRPRKNSTSGSLEGQSEHQDDQPDEAQVLVGAEERDQVVAAERDQEAESRRHGHVGEHGPDQEQEDRDEDERERVLLLLGVQAGNDEGPHLIEPDRRREDDADHRRDLQADRHRLQWRS